MEIKANPVATQAPAKQELYVEPFNNSERVPASWDIQPGPEEDTIIALNANTGRTFEGTIKAFSKLLRG